MTTTAGPQHLPARSETAKRKAPATEAVLAALAAEGQVTRGPGGRDNGRRMADRWSLPQAAPTADQAAPAGGELGAARHARDRGVEGRLGRGELRGLVAACLADNPGDEFTPSRLAALLGHSAGAIGNALARMTEDGLAVQAASSPRRYSHAPTGEPQ